MTGAGFGGCAVALVATDRSEAFVRQVAAGYRKAIGTGSEGLRLPRHERRRDRRLR